MAVVHSQYNAILTKTVSVVLSSASTVYFNIPWYPASYVDRIRIWNTDNVSTNISSIVLCNNGAHLRSGNITGRDHTFYQDGSTVTPLSTNNQTAIYNINPPAYTEDLYNRPYLSIKVVFAAGVTGTFYCAVQGRKALGTAYKNVDTTHASSTDDYRVLMGKSQTGAGYTGGTIIDVTNPARANGGLANTAEFAFESITDKVYIGSKKKIDHFDFVLSTANSSGCALTAEIWNGSAWIKVDTNDNTSSGNSDSMKFSGVIEGAGLGSSVWALAKADFSADFRLPNDPLTVLQKQVVSGLAVPQLLPYNPERYWIRFGVSALASTVYINNIFPIEEVY